MDDERVIKLLEEIRDLQRQHVENYKDALANQRESIQFNERWQKQNRRSQVMGLLVLIVVLFGIWAATLANR